MRIGAKELQMCLKNLAKYPKYLRLFCRQLSQVRKMDFWGYESTQSPIVDLDHGGPIFERGQEKKRSTTPKNWTSKIQGDVEAFKKGYWGGGY